MDLVGNPKADMFSLLRGDQERIQDFWIGGSNSERGVRFPSFASFLPKFPMKMK